MPQRYTHHPKSNCPSTQKTFQPFTWPSKNLDLIFWGANKPVIIKTDSKSVTSFFQTKMIAPPLWNACDFVLHFSFTIAHIPGKMNTAAGFSSRLDLDPNGKIILKIREDFPKNLIEVNIESTGIAQEKPVFVDTTDQQETTKKELWKRKEEARNAMPNDPPVIIVTWYYANDLHKGTTIVYIAQLTKPSRILIEQDSDPTFLIFKREMLGILLDE